MKRLSLVITGLSLAVVVGLFAARPIRANGEFRFIYPGWMSLVEKNTEETRNWQVSLPALEQGWEVTTSVRTDGRLLYEQTLNYRPEGGAHCFFGSESSRADGPCAAWSGIGSLPNGQQLWLSVEINRPDKPDSAGIGTMVVVANTINRRYLPLISDSQPAR